MERSCTVNLVTQKQHFHGKELHCKSFNTKINPLMEGSCTVNLVTQKQHFHGKELHCKHSYTQTNTFM